MAIFSVAAVFVSQSLTNGFLALQSQRTHTIYAGEIALLKRFILSLETLEKIEEGGSRPAVDGEGRFEWKAKVEPTNVLDLFKVELEITLPNEKEGSVQGVHYVYKPKGWSVAEERRALLEEKRTHYESIKSDAKP